MRGSFGGRWCRVLKSALLVAGLLAAGPLAAQEEEEAKKLGWFDEAELSLVATDGNSQSETLALRNTLTRIWQRAEFKFAVGGLRAESTSVSRSAVGTTPQDARLVETSTTEVTAERYNLDLRYEHQISDRWYWFASAGWLRNEPAGIRRRTTLAAGVGNLWFERKNARFRTDYGLSYTDQTDVVQLPGGGGFAGLRLSWEYWRQLTATATYSNEVALDQNLDDGADLRAQMVNALVVRLSDRLALKLTHEAQLDREPALTAVPITSPTGAATGDSLLVEADELDTVLGIALVVTI